MEMHEIHEKVFDFCYDQYFIEGGVLKFALRKSNRYDRLLHGYWFYGNEKYAAISFWSGSDWKNKTPNIFFGIDENGWTFLELTASDSEKKYNFFKNTFLIYIHGFEKFKNGWRKYYPEFKSDYIKSLQSFLTFEKGLIDALIRTQADDYFEKEDITFNRIDFITDEDFEKRLKNILNYRAKFDPKNILKKLPEHLKSFSLKRNFPKIDVEISNLPSNAQWIFFTGMNGTGKTNVLRGIAAGIMNNLDNYFLFNDPTLEINIKTAKGNSVNTRTVNLTDQKKKKRLVTGFATYGASRQTIVEFPEGDNFNSEEFRRKSTLTYSLFHTDGLLFNLDIAFLDTSSRYMPKEGKTQIYSLDYIQQIIELLPDIIPRLVEIIIPQVSSLEEFWSNTEYVEEDEYENRLPPVEFCELSSGARSLIAMFGDMLIRLYRQQPDVRDFSELTGIVLIDEIDVHLHPINQRKLVESLTGIFPKIQFIVTTHSPIPLLGAPKGSVFFKVERRADRGVFVTRLDQLEKEIENLLPNAIYTSEIFNLENITSVQNDSIDELDTSDDYNQFANDKRLADQIGRLKENGDDEFLKFLADEKN